jgi:hypothetical protein
MKSRAAITFVTLLAVLTIMEARGQTSNPAMTELAQNEKVQDPKEMYPRLRSLMLQGSRAKFSLGPTSKPTEPWGVVMDWGVKNGTATVVAMSDGSASVYFSSGGGYIGGQGQEPVRIAAQKAVEVARAVQSPEQSTSVYPLPEEHAVFFYLLTDAGVYMFRTSEQELNSSGHPLRKLGDAMQGVITEYRLWDQRKKANSSDGENSVRKPN